MTNGLRISLLCAGRWRAGIVAAIAGALVAGSALGATLVSLESDAIKTKVIGQPLVWKAEDGPQRGEIFFAADGTVEMTTSIPGLPRDIGTWRFEGRALCTRWATARSGGEKCYELSEEAPGFYRSTGGNIFEARNPWI